MCISGCATSKSVMLHPEVNDTTDNEIGELRGFNAVVSTNNTSIVRAAAFRLKTDTLIFHLSFENTGTHPLDIDPKEIVLHSVDKDQVTEVEIMSANDYLERLEGQQRKKELMAGMLGEMSSIVGGLAAGLIPYAGAAVGIAQQTLLRPRLDKKMNEGILASRKNMHITKDVLLKPHRLFPNTKSEGIVVAEFERADRYWLEILVGNELHRVDFHFE